MISDCSICHEIIEHGCEGVLTHCLDRYHTSCAFDWYKENKFCKKCHKPIERCLMMIIKPVNGKIEFKPFEPDNANNSAE